MSVLIFCFKKMISTKEVSLCLTLCWLWLVLVVSSDETKPRHIVFIVADDYGWNDVGFRNPNISTPNIDRLAKEGVIFNHSYVQPVCTPSRHAFMTGVYPFRSGLQHLVIWPSAATCSPTSLTFLPQRLKKLGYATHMLGKWHLGFCNWNCTPTYRGFDTFYGFLAGKEGYYTRLNGAGYDLRDNTKTADLENKTYSTYLFSDRAKQLIANHKNKSQPFFLYMPFQSVHEPIEVPIEYENMYSHIKNVGRRKFSGMVTAMDDAIGNITQALKEHGLYDNTLIVFTADNGGWPDRFGNNYPLRGSKLTVFEGGTRATAFAHGSGLIKTRYTYDGMIHAVDWNPTLLAAAGGDPEEYLHEIDGINQWENIRTGAPSNRTEFIYNLDDLSPYDNGHAAIRMGKYKLIVGYPGYYPGWYPPPEDKEDTPIKKVFYKKSDDEKIRLFNLIDDPNERTNLYKLLPDIAEKLKKRMAQYHEKMVPANFKWIELLADPENYGGYWSPGWC